MSTLKGVRSLLSNPRFLWVRYAIALSIVLALLVTSHVASLYAHRTAEKDAEYVRLSTSQIAESARMLYLSSQLYISREKSTARLLREATDRFVQNHNTLISSPDLPNLARDIYFGGAQGPSLDILSAVLAKDAYALLDPATRDPDWRLQRMTSLVRGILHRKLEQVALVLKQKADENFQRIVLVSELTFAAAIIALLIEALFIFYPAQRLVSRALSELEEKNTALQRATKDLTFEAFHDPLTALANRRHLKKYFSELGARVDAPVSLALLHIDLDHFKEINDTMGHDAGDYVLTHVAEVLRETVSDNEFVARIGGDEFLIVSLLDESDPGHRATIALAREVILRLSAPVRYDDRVCHFGASIGIDVAALSGGSLQVKTSRMLENADIALYQAKRGGRGRYAFYNEELRSQLEFEKNSFEELLPALKDGDVIAYYQPQIDVATGELHGVEALARWRHPTRGVIGPAEFLTIAAERGLAAEIDQAVLDVALRDLQRWDVMGLDVPRVSVNVSAHRIADPNLVQTVARRKTPPGRLCFEVLESVFLDKLDDVVRCNIDALSELGVFIEIDDFGTGHASLVSFLELSPHRIKIARELVSPILGSERHRRLLAAVLSVAEGLGIQTTAEGVETKEQAELLTRMGCNVLQGYYFAKPMSAEDLAARLERGEAWPSVGAKPARMRIGA